MIKSPPAFVSNPTILATTPKTSIDAETTRQTTVKAITLVDFGQKQPLVELSTKKPETLKEPGTTVEALTKSPPRRPFTSSRLPSPPPMLLDFKSPNHVPSPRPPPEQKPLPFSPSPFSIKQTGKQTPLQTQPPLQLPHLPTNLQNPQVPLNLPSGNRLPKVSPLFQDSQQRNPIIKDPGFQDPGFRVPGLTSSNLNNPGVVSHFNSFVADPLFPNKQSPPFRPSPALVGVSEPE